MNPSAASSARLVTCHDEKGSVERWGKWSERDKHPALSFPSPDGRVVQSVVRFRDGPHALRADFSIPRSPSLYYYEVEILIGGESNNICVGLSSCHSSFIRHIGWEKNSWGYHGGDGRSFSGYGWGRLHGPTFDSGDVIGCGLDFSRRVIFFTKNGIYLGLAAENVNTDVDLYPSISFYHSSKSVRGNFGQQPFIADMEELSRLLKFELGTVEAFPIRSPTRWSMYVTYPDVAVSTDGSSLTKLKSGPVLQLASGTCSNHPVSSAYPSGIYYYEVAILTMSHQSLINVGFTAVEMSPESEWTKFSSSWAYQSDGTAISDDKGPIRFGPSYEPGDVIGCGLNFIHNRIFFTKNGTFLGLVFEKVGKPQLKKKRAILQDPTTPARARWIRTSYQRLELDERVQIYPWVALQSESDSVRANFGHSAPFLYLINDHRSRFKSSTALAAVFPSELLQRILDFLRPEPDDDEEVIRVYKRAVGSCALTCRYWSTRCRPYLYETLRLTSIKDLNTLLSFLKLPASPIARSVRLLHIREDISNGRIPWGHLALIRLASKLVALEELNLERLGRPHDIHDLHSRLPPLLSGSRMSALYSAFRTVKTFDLNTHHFGSLAELSHIVAAFPALQSFKCMHISWRKRETHPRTFRAPRRLEFIEADDCTERWKIFRLLTARWGRLPTDWSSSVRCPGLDPADLSALETIVELLCRDASPFTASYESDEGNRCWYLQTQGTSMSPGFMFTLVPHTAIQHTEVESTRAVTFITEFSLFIGNFYQIKSSQLLEYPWQLIDSLFSSISKVNLVFVSLGPKVSIDSAEWTIEKLAEALAGRMPSLHTQGSLRITNA